MQRIVKVFLATLALTLSNVSIASNTSAIDLATVNQIAKLYKEDGQFTKNERVSFELYLMSAESGNIEAAYEVSTMFAKGQGVQQDYEKAYKWMSIAAKGGNEKAIQSLGAMYADNPKPLYPSVPKVEKTKIIEIEKPVSNLVDVEYDNQHIINLISSAKLNFDNGNYQQAFETFNFLAEAPYFHPTAQYYAGLIHENKKAGFYNISRAYQMFQEAASQNHPESIYQIGLYFFNGTHVVQNKTKALDLFIKAAEQGSPSAKYMLGYSYEYAHGVHPNMVEAYRWYYTGAVAMSKKSLNAKNRLEHRMPPADIKAAKRLAHQWMNNYPNDYQN